MKFYVLVDARGNPLAFYNDEVYPPNDDGTRNATIPTAAFSISQAFWQDCINNNGLRTLSVDANGLVTITEVEPPVSPVVPPAVISDRQFFQQLAYTPDPGKSDGSTIISKDDALAAVKTGTIPPAMQPLVDSISNEDARFDVEMKLSGATEFNIEDTATLAIAQVYGWSSAQLAQFWIAASQC